MRLWSFFRDLADACLSDLLESLDTVILHDEAMPRENLPLAILPNIEALEGGDLDSRHAVQNRIAASEGGDSETDEEPSFIE